MELIDRQQAIDAVRDAIISAEWPYAAEVLKSLPSIEPQIIRCKNCKWWDKHGDYDIGYCHAIKHGYHTSHWEIGIYRKYNGDFYCADAEPKETEEENDEN